MMGIRALIVAIVLVLRAGAGQADGSREHAESEVTVDVRDNYGHILPGAIEMRGEGIRYVPTSLKSFKAKYGAYQLNVAVPGFNSFADTVVVNQPRQLISVAMRLGTMDGPQFVTCSVSGRIFVKHPQKVRLMPLFGSGVIDVPIQGNGEYKFDAIECGRYLLLAIDDNSCLGVRVVTLNKDNERVDLHASAAEVSCEPAGSSKKGR